MERKLRKQAASCHQTSLTRPTRADASMMHGKTLHDRIWFAASHAQQVGLTKTQKSRAAVEGLALRDLVRSLKTAIERETVKHVLGNSGKHVTLETSSLTEFSKHVFQEQGFRDSRKSGTCESSNSRMCSVREP
jgi:hypothetical protein